MIEIRPHQVKQILGLASGTWTMSGELKQMYGAEMVANVESIVAQIIADPNIMIRISPDAIDICGSSCGKPDKNCRVKGARLRELRIKHQATGRMDDVVEYPASVLFTQNWT